ncbi:hypothetical protein Tco_0127586, partial [Tanacetum coccineum]
KMADENVLAPAPTISDDQILPFAAWVPIGKSNHVLDLQKRQKNPIFQIAVDILQNTNFFRAFTASASVPAIYIQQFWNTFTYVEKDGTYRFQLDEDWFTMDANLLREALEITPIDQAHSFVSPPSGDAIMDFVNELGYPEVIHFVLSMVVNHLYQPYRAILSMINQCLTGKTSGHDRPKYPVLQMLWGIITSTNVNYVKLMWEEFVQAMQTFLTDKANLGSPTKKRGKDKPHVIPYCLFTKLIICHLGRTHNIHQRSASLFHLAEEDLRLGNLKFVSKGEVDEVFGIPIPNEMILNNIKNAPYCNAYLSYHEEFSLADEPDEEPAHSKPEHQGEGEDFDMEHAIQISLDLFQVQGHARVGGVAIQEPVAEAIQPLPVVEGKATEEASIGSSTQPQDDTSANIVNDSLSPANVETRAESDKTNSGELDQDQAGSDPGKSLESRPQPEQVHMDEDQARPDPGISRVALAGPDPKPTYGKFIAYLYPKVQESLKFLADEHVILEDPLSSTGTLSSMKNLEDAYVIRDQFINDKSTDDELGKLNIEAEVVSMVTVPIYQASSSTAHTDSFRDLSEEDMKEMLHQRMLETGSYKLLLEHIALYEALEASMKHPPPPPPDSDLSSSKQQYGPHAEQPIEDIPIQDADNISDSEDIDSAYILKTKQRPEWLKPIPDDERPATPEPAWVIPTSHIPDAVNN